MIYLLVTYILCVLAFVSGYLLRHREATRENINHVKVNYRLALEVNRCHAIIHELSQRKEQPEDPADWWKGC